MLLSTGQSNFRHSIFNGREKKYKLRLNSFTFYEQFHCIIAWYKFQYNTSLNRILKFTISSLFFHLKRSKTYYFYNIAYLSIISLEVFSPISSIMSYLSITILYNLYKGNRIQPYFLFNIFISRSTRKHFIQQFWWTVKREDLKISTNNASKCIL